MPANKRLCHLRVTCRYKGVMTRTTIVLFICGLQFLTYTVKSQGKDSIPTDWRLETMNNFYKTKSPLEFIKILRMDTRNNNTFHFLTLPTSPDNWVKEEHIPELMKLIYKTDSTRSIVNMLSSYLPNNPSSIGREAQNLIECFKAKTGYPPLYSYGQPDKKKGKVLEDWWTDYRKSKP
jgi:hypothetical protein